MLKNTESIIQKVLNRGLNTSKNFFNLQEGQSPACINVEFNKDGSISKRLGTSTMNTVALESTGGYGMFDLGILGRGGIDSYTKLLIHCDGADASTSFSDSATGKTVTAAGNAQVDTAQKKFGTGSCLLDGTGDYLSLADHNDWNFGTGTFTVDFWVRFNALPGNGATMGLFQQQGDGSNYYNLYILNNAGQYRFDWRVATTAGGTIIQFNANVTIATGTWYHVALVRNGNDFNVYLDGTSAGGVTDADAIPDLGGAFEIGNIAISTPGAALNGWIDEFRVSKGIARWTSNFTVPIEAYNSDTTQERRLLCSSGTGIYYSKDIGRTWIIAQTNRTANINYFSFVKDYVINTNESYDVPQYWTGSSESYFANISTATPACKHSLANQGFLILLNESANKTGFYYVDQNSMFSSAFSSFKLPTDRNDELTGGFSLGRILYISSKYKMFRLLYTGGNPDWIYTEIKDFGFIPKTIKKVNISGLGEVAIGMDWSKKIRIFDGSNDEVISDIVSDNNNITPFYINNVSDLNLNKCWAEDDKKAQIYRLHLVYGSSSTISYSLNFNYRSGSLYPEDNRTFQSGILAKDTADTSYMLACDYNGRIHQLDSGNTDNGTAINEYYVSPLLYRKSPSSVHKSQIMDLFFSVSSSGTIYYEDRNQFDNYWNGYKEITLINTISSLQIRQTVDISKTQNVYQYKLSSSSNTASPWQLNLADYEMAGLGIGKP